MNKVFTENYNHDNFLKSYYAYKLCDDFSKTNYKFRISYLFGRYVFAYGLKWEQPLIALSILIALSSFVFLFTGITYDGIYLNRDFVFNFNETFNTIKDFLDCLYLSFCSALNIGLNFGINKFGINVYKSIESFAGTVLITIFTFNLVRKYIK